MDIGLPGVVAVAVVLDALVLGALLLAPMPGDLDRRRTRVGVVHGALATLAALLMFAAKVAVALSLADLNGFGFLNLLYKELVVVVPLASAFLLVAHRRGRVGRRSFSLTTPVLACATYALLLAPLGLYATFVEPTRVRLEVRTVPIAAERDGDDPVRIGVLADLQTARLSTYEHQAVARLLAQRPDVVLVAGDLFQGSDAAFDRALPELRRLLGTIEAPGGVFAVAGNVDRADRLERAATGTGVRALRNEVARAVVGDRALTVAGVDYWAMEGSAGFLQTVETDPRAGDVRIVLAHRPDAVLDLPVDSRVDLVIAGHTHGGQVRLPLLGPMITLSGVPKVVAAGGLHEVAGNRVYVSRGVGSERGQAPLVRLNCPPEITILELADAP